MNYDPAVNLIVACVALGMSALVLSLWPPDEAKIETEHEEDEMDDGAASADLGYPVPNRGTETLARYR